MNSHRFHIRPRLGIARGPRRGIAMMWALIGITVIALLSVAAMHLARGEQMVNDNFDSGRRALYLADQGLSQFYANFKPTTDLSLPVISSVDDQDSSDVAVDSVADGDAVDSVNSAFDGADLKVSNLHFENGDAIVTPYKIVESQFGDIYLLEATAAVYDSRGDRPDAIRSLRTYASLQPPFKLRGALSAPGHINAPAPGALNKAGVWVGCPSGQCEHFHLDGGKKGKCGSGIGVPPLATPSIGFTKLASAKVHLKADAKSGSVAIDSTTDTYREMMDSLHVDFAAMSQDSYYAGLTNFVDVPRDYPTLNAVGAAFKTKTWARNALWPVVLVHGDATVSGADMNGWGMLVVEGNLTVSDKKLDWRGVILTGKALNVTGTAHLHEHGAVAAGLGCTNAEALAGFCNVNFTGAHLGIAYAQCEAEAAWAQMLVLRPLTPSRHTRLY